MLARYAAVHGRCKASLPHCEIISHCSRYASVLTYTAGFFELVELFVKLPKSIRYRILNQLYHIAKFPHCHLLYKTHLQIAADMDATYRLFLTTKLDALKNGINQDPYGRKLWILSYAYKTAEEPKNIREALAHLKITLRDIEDIYITIRDDTGWRLVLAELNDVLRRFFRYPFDRVTVTLTVRSGRF